MVDFRQADRNRRSRDYSSRRQQYRLLLWVFVVMGAISLAAKTVNWSLFGLREVDAQSAAANPRDTRMSKSLDLAEPLTPGTFRIEPDPPSRVAQDLPAATEDGLPLKFSNSIDFRHVKDDTVFRAAESQAWYELLSQLSSADGNEVRTRSSGTTTFEQLYDSPETYRGRMVNLSGTIRRAHYLTAPPNAFGVDGYWQCWLYTDGGNDPLVVYCLELPAEFPSGMKIQERATMTAVFFKRWAYMSASGARLAPLLIAASAKWYPAAAETPVVLPSRRQVLLALSGALVLALGVSRFVMRSSRSLIAHRPMESPRIIAAAGPSVEKATSDFLDGLDQEGTRRA